MIDVVGEGLGAEQVIASRERPAIGSWAYPFSTAAFPWRECIPTPPASRFPPPRRYRHQQPAAAPGGALPAEDRRGAGFQLGVGVRLARRGRTSAADGQYPELPEVPDQIFGAQLAFNLLSRLGRSGKGEMEALEARLRRQLHHYLGGRVPVPALRLITVPVFYSVGGLSLR